MKKNRIVTKIVAGIMIALGLMVLGASLLLMFNCNSPLAVGYSSSVFDDDETGLCTGIVISKRKTNLDNDVKMTFSYGYLKEEEYKDFQVIIYLEDEMDGMIVLKDEKIDDFYSDNYLCIKPGLLNSDIKYKKYEEISYCFKDLVKGKVVIELYYKDKNNQQLTKSSEIEYTVQKDYKKVEFNTK